MAGDQQTSGEDGNDLHVADFGPQRRLPLSYVVKIGRRQVLGTLIVLLIVILALWIFHIRPFKKPLDTEQQITTAQHLGQYDKAIKLTNDTIAKTSSPSKKADLYVTLANNYLNNNNPDQAINAYLNAAKTNGMTYNIAYLLGSTYEGKKDNQEAIQYYQQAIKLWPKKDSLYAAQVNALQQDINALQKDKTQ